MKIKSKLLISFLAIYLVSISTLVIFSYLGAKKTVTKQIFNQLESVVSTQHKRVEAMIDQNIERLQLVTSRTQLRLSLNNYNKTGDPSDLKKISKIIHDARTSIHSFEDISVQNLQGKVVSSTDSSMEGLTLADEEFFVRGITDNNVDMIFHDRDGKLKGYLSGPLYLKGSLLGVLVIKFGLQDLFALTSDYSGMGSTGETLLARRDRNGDALFLTPLRFAPDAALKKTIPKDDLRKPIIQALAGNESFFEKAVDYRGNEVLSATRYIKKTEWGLVAKIDTKEAFEPIVNLWYMLLVIIFISSVLIITISVYLAGTITRPIKDLAEFARSLSKGNLSQKIEIRSNDETGELAQTFNEMASSLDTATKKLEEKVKEKEVLLRELHHRTKNNMQVISSLLNLQSDKIEDKHYSELFLESTNRIRSMALIHEKLYMSKDIANIDLDDYIRSIAHNLLNTYEINSRRISLKTDIDTAALSIDTAIPCGLIINELLSNAMKHAFPGERSGEITVSFKKKSGNKYTLTVSDNGIGLPENLNIEESKSLGLKLVTTLATNQLRGKLEILRENGARFNIHFTV